MAIYMTARYRVKPETLQECVFAVHDFIDYIKANEPRTLQYTSVQDEEDPHTFLNFFVFEDAAADEAHRSSPGTQQFVDRLYPNLIGDVEFKRYHLVATT